MLGVILVVIVCLTNALLGAIVLVNNPQARLNRIFSALAVSAGIWSAIVFLEDQFMDDRTLNLLARSDYAVAAILLALLFLFAKQLSGIKGRRWEGALVLFLASASAVLSAFGLVTIVAKKGSDIVFEPGQYFILFTILLVVALLGGGYYLVVANRRMKGKALQQVKFISLGLVLSCITLVSADIIAPRFFNLNSADVSRLGIYGILFLVGFSTYAIVKHRFLDIRLLVTRTLTYLLLLATLAGLYAAAIFGISQLFFQDSAISTAQNVTYIGIAIVLAFTFQPLRAFFERITDSIFYRDRYDTQEVLGRMGKIFASEIVLDALLDKVLAELCGSLNLSTAQVILVKNRKITNVSHFGPLPDKLMTIPELGKFGRPLIVGDELQSGERKEILDRHGLRVSLLLRTKEGFIGFLLLGDKKSGDIYSNQDLRFLAIFAQDLSIGIQNAKAYAEIQAFSQTLQDRVDRATTKLRIANKNLKDLDMAKDEFISMASHQLRTPLTTIKGYLSMIVEGDAGPVTPRQQEFLSYTYDGAQRMVSLISDLLNVSRMSAGRFMIERATVDFVAMAADEVDRLQSHAKVKNLALTFRSSTAKLPVSIDEGKTRQVIMNYIDNAIYYTKTGKIDVRVAKVGNTVKLTVTDTGIGVPEVAKAKLFSKFYRAGNAQAARPDGTGLGLFMAKRVILDQGGTIIFESTEGQGSTFGFILPLTP